MDQWWFCGCPVRFCLAAWRRVIVSCSVQLSFLSRRKVALANWSACGALVQELTHEQLRCVSTVENNIRFIGVNDAVSQLTRAFRDSVR